MKAAFAIAGIFLFCCFIGIGFAETVPDTGQVRCYDNTKQIPCPEPGEPFFGQDGNYTIHPPSYTKLDAQGNDLPDTAESWVMVRDNVTGLIWEVKNGKDGIKDYSNPNDVDNIYSWYDPDPSTNGGYAGPDGDGTDTLDFIESINTANFGGHSDWRLPTIEELRTIADSDEHRPSVDSKYFLLIECCYYLSSSASISNSNLVWYLSQQYGGSYYAFYKTSKAHVIAVRNGL